MRPCPILPLRPSKPRSPRSQWRCPLLALPPGGLWTPRGLGLVVTAFVAFRVLDVLKPPPIRWAERSFAGGLGVMLDDVVAGVMAGAITAAALAAFGGPA